MTSALIQFRLSGEALEALQSLTDDGESLNLTAQRLMKQLLLGSSPVIPMSTLASTTSTTSTTSTETVTEIVESIVEEKFNCIQKRLQELEAEVKKLPARLM